MGIFRTLSIIEYPVNSNVYPYSRQTTPDNSDYRFLSLRAFKIEHNTVFIIVSMLGNILTVPLETVTSFRHIYVIIIL